LIPGCRAGASRIAGAVEVEGDAVWSGMEAIVELSGKGGIEAVVVVVIVVGTPEDKFIASPLETATSLACEGVVDVSKEAELLAARTSAALRWW